MTLRAGARLGPYEIVEPIGAGGMGEVYKAHDTRIGRAVAIKVLPPDVESDPDRRRRFHQEAVAAGALNHPNVLVVHDVGADADRPFLVTELLHGRTLRELLRRGPLPEEKAVRYTAALLDGLASAHAQGIVHRDLKPANIFITDDDVPKILDFGLARLPAGFRWTDGTATSAGTGAGVLLGSVGYMAPEQVTGGEIDHRTDLFSMSVVLHEMLTGRSPFAGDTAIAILNAIVTVEVEPPSTVSAGVRAVLQRGLQKSPARRFQSASDFAFALRLPDPRVAGPAARSPSLRTIAFASAALVIAGAALGAVALHTWGTPTPPVSAVRFQRITFQPGRVWSARFVPGSDTIVYAASWKDQPNRVYSARAGFPAATDLGLPPADLLGVSSAGELALLLGRRWLRGMEPSSGVLARAGIAGSAPRELVEGVTSGDWTPDGNHLVAVRDLGRVRRLEFPLHHGVYDTAGWIDSVRVSHDGTRVAFADHPLRNDDRGDVVIADGSGNTTRLARDLGTAKGLVWGPGDRELWGTVGSQVVAYDMKGASRTVFRDPRLFTLLDVASDGRLLIVVDQRRGGLNGRLDGDTAERDLTWFDYSVARDLTPDGRALLFFEASEIAGDEYIVGLWRAGDAAPVRVGEGHATSLSADGKSALAIILSRRIGFRILPTGVGEAREVLTPALANLSWVTWLPDGQHVVVSGNEPGRGSRLYVVDLAGRIVRSVGPEGTFYQSNAVSPDGSRIAAQDPERRLTLYRMDDGAATIVPGMSPDEQPEGWSTDGAELFVLTPGIPSKVSRVNVTTGARTPWRELMPSDPTGVVRISPVLVTPDGRSYAYTYGRFLSTLYVVNGLR
jgi:serine/threonine protein kinase/sugar lactone lactonase YvrE